jgi:BA14K-like protein
MLMISKRKRAAAALLTVAVLAAAAPATAAPIGQPLAARPAGGLAEQVHWRGRGWGWGPGAYFGLGPYYYYYDSGYRPWDYADPDPRYLPPPEGDLQSCMQRHKSYNPRTGLYPGKDGRRHRCP